MNEEIDLCGQGTQASLNVPVRKGGGVEERGGEGEEGGGVEERGEEGEEGGRREERKERKGETVHRRHENITPNERWWRYLLMENDTYLVKA